MKKKITKEDEELGIIDKVCSPYLQKALEKIHNKSWYDRIRSKINTEAWFISRLGFFKWLKRQF